MSLKAFHVFFIIVATLCAAGFGAWGIHDYTHTADAWNLSLGIASLVITGLLIWYFTWFLKKLKNVSYL